MTRLVAALVVALAILGGCGSESSAPPTGTTSADGAAAEVRDVSTVLDLRGAFNEDRGSTRLLLILSPT